MAQTSKENLRKSLRVRGLILDEIEKTLTQDPMKLTEGELQYRREMLLRLSPNVIPKVTILQGDEDGGPVAVYDASKMTKQELDLALMARINGEQPTTTNSSKGPIGESTLPINSTPESGDGSGTSSAAQA